MRRSLTPKQRADMLADQDGKCAKCGAEIDGTGKTCIAEHWAMVALGNDQKPDCLLCLHCADVKTNGTPATTYGSDKHALAKAIRIEGGGRKVKQPFRKPPPGYKHQWGKRKVGQ